MLQPFTLHRPHSLTEALQLRQELGPDSMWYAGGTELLFVMQHAGLWTDHLIDVKQIAELGGVNVADGVLRLGAAMSHRAVQCDPLVLRTFPILSQLEGKIANVRVRMMGTIGGNIAFAEPHADPPTLLSALDAKVRLVGLTTERTLSITEFLISAFESALADDELLAGIEIPVPPPGMRLSHQRFVTLERPAVVVAAAAHTEGGVVTSPTTVVVGAVNDCPLVLRLEQAVGEPPGAESVQQDAAEMAGEAVDPVGDLSGNAAFKRHIVRVLARRALQGLNA